MSEAEEIMDNLPAPAVKFKSRNEAAVYLDGVWEDWRNCIGDDEADAVIEAMWRRYGSET